MRRFEERTPRGVIPAMVHLPLIKLPAAEIARLKAAIAAAGLAREPASALAAE